MAQKVAIVGTGQTDHKSHRPDVTGQEMIREAVDRALEDCGITIRDIDAIVIGNMDHFESINYVDNWSIEGSGGFMKPIMKVTTGGTTGASVAIAAYYHVASGMFDRVLAIGWEKNSESDTTGAIITCSDPIWDRFSYSGAIPSLATEATAYMKQYGATQEDAARVAVRDRNNALNNPHAHLQRPITLEDVMSSPMLAHPIKLLDVCPRTDGACAVVFAADGEAQRLAKKPAWIHASAVRHTYSWFGDSTDYDAGLVSLARASQEAYKKAGITDPSRELDVAELYLPYTYAGIKWIEDLKFCGRGEGAKFVREGNTNMDGMIPVNPSGGVISTNCIGATALLRVAEASIQVMGKGGKRQLPKVNKALATGFGGCFWSDVMILGAERS
ncbi:acetyl-CoA C-acetyltransferase [Desulfatibacillum alkenivorans DSM 16219]|jgi:acetyl-CoA C-acetyltransferase|uniref:Acetyl-CoA C-acetyltransferase n=1 Tax=Desulfatibacillum alkenivorans DSM 16219 TaxID=1121393 RepID=A0A1M6Z953_9BACT|nr:propanoyl-CoA acyltransferase [Desulfatibacillum alkenivorans]SHL26923.1 acetyl-CoA C-acetyltransferase [Desulfatibacillum alkenivorans DSM 16219]